MAPARSLPPTAGRASASASMGPSSCGRTSSSGSDRRKTARQNAIADRLAEQLVDYEHGSGVPRQQRLPATLDDEPDDVIDAFLDGPDAERRRRRLGPRSAVRTEDISAQWRVHKRRRDDADVDAVAAQFDAQR